MSILRIRLKQRTRVLAAGVALSAAPLALLPGVAEANLKGICPRVLERAEDQNE